MKVGDTVRIQQMAVPVQVVDVTPEGFLWSAPPVSGFSGFETLDPAATKALLEREAKHADAQRRATRNRDNRQHWDAKYMQLMRAIRQLS